MKTPQPPLKSDLIFTWLWPLFIYEDLILPLFNKSEKWNMIRWWIRASLVPENYNVVFKWNTGIETLQQQVSPELKEEDI